MESRPGVVVGEKNAEVPLVPEAADETLDLGDGDRVDTGERFVQEDELGLGSQGFLRLCSRAPWMVMPSRYAASGSDGCHTRH